MRKFFTLRLTVAVLSFLLMAVTVSAQVNISATGSYSQNFNSLTTSTTNAAWSNNATLTNWYAQSFLLASVNIAANTGTGTTGQLYSYGASLAADRALGTIGSNTTGDLAYGVLLQNTSGSTITDIKLSYTLEQWRNGGNTSAQPLTVYYKVSSSPITDLNPISNPGWTAVPAATLSSMVNTSTAAALDGNSNKVSVANVALAGILVPAGSYVMVKWDDINNSGNDHGLAIDDVTLNWTVPPSNNANLSSLTMTDGAANPISLSPAFASSTTMYNAGSVSNTTTPVYLNFTRSNASSFVEARINGGGYNSPLLAFNLNVGSNTIDVHVVAQDGVTSNLYTITITRSPAATPVLSAGAAPADFGNTCTGTTAGPGSFTLNATDLDGTSVNVAALAGYSFATTSNGAYTSTLSLPAGSVYPQTIYVKFTPAAVQSYNGNIIISGGGAAAITVPVTGAGINTTATVSTGAAVVTGTSAQLNGIIGSTGCSNVSAYGFEYSTVPGFAAGSGTSAAASNLSGSAFSKTIAGLTGGVTYYYRAFATNSGGTVYGAENSFTASAVVPVVMSAQPLFRYTENFTDIGGWANNFASGNGANHFSSTDINTAGTIPSATKITTSSATFSSSTSGGVQKGTGNIVLLATGTTDNSSSVAVDFYMDFTGMNAGSLSFDWASINNSTGNRNGSLRVYASVDGVNFTEIAGAAVLNITNNVPSTGTVNSIALPASFNNAATARLRFYYYNGTGGTTGSRPKISIDNLTVTGVASAPCTTPSAGATSLVFGTITDSTIQASFTAASPAPNEYLVIVSSNSSLTSNPIDGQVYNVGDNVGDGDVIAKGSATSFTAPALDGNTTYYFFIFPVNSVCTGGPLYSVPNVLTGSTATAAGLPQCAAPADQAINLQFAASGINSISGSFNAGTGNEYLVLQSTGNSLSNSPVNGHVYNAGEILGNAKVVQRGSNTGFTASGLNPSTAYYFYVFSLNSQGCLNGPVYNTVSPLAGSQTTAALPACATPGSQPTNLSLNASNSVVTGTFNGITNSNYQYLVIRSSASSLSGVPADNTDYNIGDNLGGGVVVSSSASTSFSSGGLAATTTYYFFVFAMDKNCSGGTKYQVNAPLSGSATTTSTPLNNYYFGTLHSHSDYSDGNKDHPGYKPTDDYNYALGSHGMDFLGISEHNHFSSLDNPGNELAKYHSGLVEAANFTAAHPGFLALYGMEWGVISGGGHVVVYGDQMNNLFGWESNVNGNVGPNYDVYVPKSVYTGPNGLFKTVNDYIAKNTFATLAHPNNTDYNNLSNIPYDAQADSAITGVAVESGPATSTNTSYSNPGSSMFYLWYYQKLLSKGYHLGPTIDHDNHNTTFGRTTNARTAVLAPALTQTELMKAVHDMHFYATEDYDTKVDFTINNRIMGSIFTDRNAPSISVNVTDATDDYSGALIRVMYGVPGSNVFPVVVDSVFGSSLNFVDNNLPNNATGYYYIDITKGSTRTVTSPIWYTRTCVISNDITVTACDSYNWAGTLYTTSTTASKTFTTTGGCDSTVTLHLTINYSPASATVSAPAGTNGCPGTGVALTAAVNDGGNGAITTYQWLLNGNPVAGANAANHTAMQSGVYSLVAGNANGCSVTSNGVTVTVADNIPPTVITKNLTVFLDASGNAAVSAAQVNNGSSDNCGVASISLNKTNFTCSDIGNNTVTLTVTDGSGNTATGTATVTVADNTKPNVVTQNITVTLGAGGTATITAAQVDNGSTDNCGAVSLALDKTSFSCANIGANTVTLTVTDTHGNSDFKTATVTVIGTVYVTNINTGKNFCTIQSAVSDAQTLAGHTLEVQPGTYNEQVLVNKGVTIRGVGATQPVVSFNGTPAGKKTLFDVSANNVTIENLNIRVDQAKLVSAIIASGATVNNVSVKNNKVDAYASSNAAPTGSYSDRNAVSINYSGATNYRFSSNVSVTYTGNTVTGMANDGFGVSRYFRSGVAADDAGGVFSNNTSQSINHDVIVRFGNNGGVTIANNIFNGGGVELSDFNGGAGSLNVTGNSFNAAFANVVASNTAVLRLKNNYNSRVTNVSGNTFTDHEWAVSLENYNAVTLDNNSFTPLAGSTTYHHITVNTKSINTNSATIVQKTIGATITNNTFNGSGANGGTALAFLNHDSDAASFGSFQVGAPGSENSFNAGIKTFIALDNQSGSSAGAAFPAYTSVIGSGAGAITTMAPWTTSILAMNNRFDAGAGLKLPAAMSNTELFTVEDKIQHKIDLASLGFVTVKAGHDFVTVNSFLAPGSNAASIQRGVDAASNGFIVNVGPGVFTDNVTVNKPVSIQGQGESATKVIPATSNPNCGGSGGGSLCAGSSNLFLVKANNVTISQLTIDGDNPAISSATVVGGADVDARNGIITDHASGIYNNLAVNHVTVKNIFLRGIYASSGGSFLFNNNTVDNVRGNSSSIGLFNFGGAGSFIANTVSNCNDAIASNWSTGSSYTNNIVTGSGSGIHTDNNGGNGGVADLIQGNSVSNSSPNGYGIWVFAPYVPALVRANTVSNVDVGLAAAGQQAAVTTVFERNTVDGQNKANSTGVYVTTDLFGFGASDVSAVFQNNFIRNNADGFYLESEAGNSLSLQAHNNSITGNTNTNVTKATGASGAGNFTVGMECNWWGTTVTSAIAASISGSGVVFNPRLTNGTDVDPAGAGFQPMPVCANPINNAQVVSISNVNCYGSATGTATISFAEGRPAFSYSVNGGTAVAAGGSPFTINGLAAGAYTVTVTEGDGNSAAVNFNITQPAAPISVNFAFTPILCNGGLSMQNLAIYGGTAPYTVTNQGGGVFVSGAAEGVTYSGNTYAANYVYTVTDANGCQYVFTANIPQPSALVVTATATDILCPGGSSTVKVSANGGTAPYVGTGSFNVNAGTYTYTVTDANGCTAAAVVTPVVVPDVTAPIITAPANINVNANIGSCTASGVALGTPVTADNCGVASVGNDAPAVFPVGTTTVTWTVTDNSGNSASATQLVTVVDAQKPVIVAPGNYSVPNDAGECRARINNLGSPVVSDNCGVAAVSNDHPSPYFPIGTTVVVWTVTDIHGNTSDTVHQLVTVMDNELPTILVSDISTVNAAGLCNATVTLAAPATGDNCGVASVSNDHPSALFPVGVTYVHWKVTDVNGWSATATQKVTVADAERPAITTVAAQAFCSNGSGNYTVPSVVATDNCGVQDLGFAITGATTRNGTGADASGNFAVGVSTITWTVTDVHGNSNTSTTTVTINSVPAVTITVSTPNAFCNKLTLTASAGPGASYQWFAGSTPFANTQQVELSAANGDGNYTVYAVNSGCTSPSATYNYQKQNLSSSYTILTFKDTKIGKYNKVNSGSVGVMSNNSEAEFKSYSSVTGAGSFVKAPRIDRIGSNITINQSVIGVATVTLPTMQFNTASTKNLPSMNAAVQNATINGNFNNLTVKKGVSVTVTGNVFGTVKLEEGASIKFTNPVLDIESLVADKGAKNGNNSYIRFAPATAVRIAGKVSFGSQVWVNPDNNQVTFYMGDLKSDEEKFTVTGGNTRVTANVYMPDGKLKVISTDADNDDHDACDHRAHTASACKHKGHDHNDCDHRAHNPGDCSDDVYMTGLFIAETVESRGNTVIWNSFSCGTPPAVLTGTAPTATQLLTAENLKAETSDADLKVTVMPNPSTSYFTLRFESRFETPLNMRVMDAGGRVVDARSKLGANSTLQIGQNYASGKYYAEITQGGTRKVVQLIKGRG